MRGRSVVCGRGGGGEPVSEDRDRSLFVCDKCGHVNGARCAECGREMLCGTVAVPCPRAGCLEGVLPDPQADLQGGPVEKPRRRARV